MPLAADARRILPHLSTEFTVEDLERWVPWLRRRYPDLLNHRQKLIQAIRGLEQTNAVVRLDTETWRKQSPGDRSDASLDLGLTQGTQIDREELAEILQMAGSAALQRGMFKRASGPFQDHLLLFHDPEENPYGDVVGSDLIHYVGQGQEGDQRLQSYNKYLAEHLKRGLTVHFFVKREGSTDFHYRGEVICEGVRRVYRPDEDRSVLEFELVPVEPIFLQEERNPLDYYNKVQTEILTTAAEPRLVDRPARVTVAQRLVRNVAFRDVLLDAYDWHCAVCGVPIKHMGLTELEAAHIVGVSERGPDDPRNGLSLCVRHHWAFDNGVWTLNHDWEIESFLEGEDPHGELNDGSQLHVPEDEARAPHPVYIQVHRDKWLTANG